jgi:hypothetical protein
MRNVTGFFSLGIFIAISGIQTLAQTGTSISQIPIESEVKTKKKLGFEVSVKSQSSLESPSDPNHEAESSVWLSPNYQITPDLKASALLVYFRDHQNAAEPNRISNLKLVLSGFKARLSKTLALTPAIAGRLPTNREARSDDTFQGSVGIEPKLSFESGAWLANYRLAIVRNIHELTLDRNGEANLQYTVSNLLNLGYKISKRVSILVSGEAIVGRTYRDFERNKFEIYEEINFAVSDALSFDLGHSNSGSALKPNLRDSNVAVYSDQSSVIYGSINYVY